MRNKLIVWLYRFLTKDKSYKTDVANANCRYVRMIDRVILGYFVALTALSIVIALVGPNILGGTAVGWRVRAIIFWLAGLPGPILISTPLAFYFGLATLKKSDISVKNADCFDKIARVTRFVFNKTGTLTAGDFFIDRIIEAPDSEQDVLRMAAIGELYSKHPIAACIRQGYADYIGGYLNPTEGYSIYGAYSKYNGLVGDGIDEAAIDISDYNEIAGRGVTASYDGCELVVGNIGLMELRKITGIVDVARASTGTAYKTIEDEIEGNPVYVAYNGKCLGAVVIKDHVKEHVPLSMDALKREQNVELTLITGESEENAASLALALNMDEACSKLLPDGKIRCLQKVMKNKQSRAKVAFVGDASNDGSLFVLPDISMVIGVKKGFKADVRIADDDIRKVVKTYRTSRRVFKLMVLNIEFTAVCKLAVMLLGLFGVIGFNITVICDIIVFALCVLNASGVPGKVFLLPKIGIQ